MWAASWASISAEDAASFELRQLQSWCLQPHTPSAGIPLTVSDLERVCHIGLQSKSPLHLKGMNCMVKVASALQASRQWRDVLRPRHTVSQTWEMLQTQEPAFKGKNKNTFFCSKCTCFYDLWTIVANGAIKFWLQNTLPRILCGILLLSHCHWNTKHLPKVTNSRGKTRLGWVSRCLCNEYESLDFGDVDVMVMCMCV